MKVLVACEYSGTVRDAFIKSGHDAWSLDILPTDSPGPHIQGDLLKELQNFYAWDLIIAHPPCTYLTVAGNKWMKPEFSKRFPGRSQQRVFAKNFFMLIAAARCKRIAIENPVGIMSTAWRRPDQIIQPYWFGHPVRKATCLWLKGLPKLIPTNIVEPLIDTFKSGNSQSRWHTQTGYIQDRVERSKVRSKTFQGIADAMAQQWGTQPPSSGGGE